MRAWRWLVPSVLVLFVGVSQAASIPRTPRLATAPQGRILGGMQLESDADGVFELVTNRLDEGGMLSLGQYSGQLAGVAVGRYDGRLLGLTRDGVLTAYGDNPEILALGDGRWNFIDLSWFGVGPLALGYHDGALWLATLDPANQTWLEESEPVVVDSQVHRAILVPLEDELHLIWSARAADLSRGALRHRVRNADGWREEPPLALGDVDYFAVFRQGDGLVLAARVSSPLDTEAEPALVTRAWFDGGWQPEHPLPKEAAERLRTAWDAAGVWSGNHNHWLTTGPDGAYLLSPHAAVPDDTGLSLVPEQSIRHVLRLAPGPADEFPWSEATSLAILVGMIVLAIVYCRRSRVLSRVFPGRPPDLTSRAVALLVDWLLVSIAVTAYHWVAGDFRIYHALLSIESVNQMFWINLAALSVFTMAGEAWTGQTPGKWLAGLRVRSVLGGPASILQVILRNIGRLLDMFPLFFPGTIGAVVAMLNIRRQRVGDMLGATMVRRHAPLDQRKFLLASASPRRLELLSALGVQVEQVPSDIDEDAIRGDTPEDTVKLLAQAKAKAAADKITVAAEIVVAADTMVLLDGDVLGKPADAAEARAMLRRLSGRSHEVLTGVSIWDSATGQGLSDVELTTVEFRPLSDRDVDEYVATGDPLDKAGAYGVQTGFLVREVRGSLSNVAGLPMELLQSMLAMLDS